MFPSSCQQLPTTQQSPTPSAIFFRIFGGCSMLTARNAAIGGPTSPTVSTGLRTVSALPISPRNCRSYRRRTRTGSWRHCCATRLVLAAPARPPAPVKNREPTGCNPGLQSVEFCLAVAPCSCRRGKPEHAAAAVLAFRRRGRHDLIGLRRCTEGLPTALRLALIDQRE